MVLGDFLWLRTKRAVMVSGRVMAEPTTTAVAPRSRAARSSSGSVMWPSTSTGIVKRATMDWTRGQETVRWLAVSAV